MFVSPKEQPVKRDVSPRAPKKTKEEIQEGATREREAHRKGHGHHNKRARKAAHTRTIEEEEAEELGEEEAVRGVKRGGEEGFSVSNEWRTVFTVLVMLLFYC